MLVLGLGYGGGVVRQRAAIERTGVRTIPCSPESPVNLSDALSHRLQYHETRKLVASSTGSCVDAEAQLERVYSDFVRDTAWAPVRANRYNQVQAIFNNVSNVQLN